jgi:hypothetical protein
MCRKIPEELKAQNAFCFPIGWRFFFDPIINTSKSSISATTLDGLVLLGKSGKKYFTVEGAASHCRKELGPIDQLAEHFYAHVGLSPPEEEGSKKRRGEAEGLERPEERGSNKRRKTVPDEIAATHSVSTASSLDPAPPVQHNRDQPLKLEELYLRRCRHCDMCIREECQKCASCKLNASRTRRCKEVCLRKVSAVNDSIVTMKLQLIFRVESVSARCV